MTDIPFIHDYVIDNIKADNLLDWDEIAEEHGISIEDYYSREELDEARKEWSKEHSKLGETKRHRPRENSGLSQGRHSMITAEERATWRSEHAGCVRSGPSCLSAVVRLLDELETAERELSLTRAVVKCIRKGIAAGHMSWVEDALAAYDAREVTP
jgi:hypothetical protein